MVYRRFPESQFCGKIFSRGRRFLERRCRDAATTDHSIAAGPARGRCGGRRGISCPSATASSGPDQLRHLRCTEAAAVDQVARTPATTQRLRAGPALT